jgi:SAM-dependent methyltransferase
VEAQEYARIAAAEDEHWWYRNTRALMSDALGPWLRDGQVILDAGCGPGGNGSWLSAHGRVVGLDRAPDALEFVRTRRPALLPVRASVEALPHPDERFDIVVAVTVVYCVPDDARAIRELARVMRPGAALLLFEPAFPVLRREHDTTVHGLRRYRRGTLGELARAAGLQIERSTYVYSFLAPAALGLALADRVRSRRSTEPASDVERRWLDGAFDPLGRLERRWLTRHRVPFGTSALLVASRPG